MTDVAAQEKRTKNSKNYLKGLKRFPHPISELKELFNIFLLIYDDVLMNMYTRLNDLFEQSRKDPDVPYTVYHTEDTRDQWCMNYSRP